MCDGRQTGMETHLRCACWGSTTGGTCTTEPADKSSLPMLSNVRNSSAEEPSGGDDTVARFCGRCAACRVMAERVTTSKIRWSGKGLQHRSSIASAHLPPPSCRQNHAAMLV